MGYAPQPTDDCQGEMRIGVKDKMVAVEQAGPQSTCCKVDVRRSEG